MRSLLLLLAWLLPPAGLPAQGLLSGKVMDADNGEAVPFATVYFDGTTNGQTTDEAGAFQFALSGMELPATLVVSHVGYETFTLTVGEAGLVPTIRLRARAQTVGTIVVEDRNRRQDNLREFRRAFLGDREWGQNARIRNEEALLFDREYQTERVNTTIPYLRRKIRESTQIVAGRWATDSSYYEFEQPLRFAASATMPLVIDLPDLGYELQVDLVGFELDYVAGRTSYLGRYFFRPAEGPAGEPRPRHRKNRQRAYHNSPQHFLRSLQAGVLAENGYQVLERSRNGKAVEPFDLNAHLERIDEETMAITGLRNRKLIILYYGDAQGRPLSPDRWKRTQPVQSGIEIGGDRCSIRSDGTVGDSPLYFSGYMGNLGVAYLLPSDWRG